MSERDETSLDGQQKATSRTGNDDMLNERSEKTTQRKEQVNVESPEGQHKAGQRSLQQKVMVTSRTGNDDVLNEGNQKATQMKRPIDVKSSKGQQKVELRSLLKLQPTLWAVQKATGSTGNDDMLKDDNQKGTQRKGQVDVKSPEGQQKISLLKLQPKVLLTDIAKDRPRKNKEELQKSEVKFETEEEPDLDGDYYGDNEENRDLGEEKKPMLEDSEESTDEATQNTDEEVLATADNKMSFLDYLKVKPDTEAVAVLNMKLTENNDEEFGPIYEPDFENLTESVLKVAENLEKGLQKSREEGSGKKIYQCALCGYQNKTKKRVCEHVEYHVAVMRQALVSCDECDTHMPNTFMSLHTQKHKQKHPPLPDIIAFVERDIRNDLAFFLIHETGKVSAHPQCRYCYMQFRRLDFYKTHFMLHHTFKYVCRLCGKSLFSYLQMFKHVQCHKAEGHVMGGTFPGAGEDESGGPCLYCQRDFPSKETLMQHIYESHSEDTNVTSYPCPKCTMVLFSNKIFKEHLRNHDVFKCKAVGCSEIFPRQLDLHRHEIKQHKPPHIKQSFLCSTCGRSYKSNAKLTEHVQFMHEGREPLKCPQCNRQFQSKEGYKYHMKVHRITTYQYVCEHCGDRFKTGALLCFHRKKHEEKVTHTCHKCQAKFMKKFSLEIHLVNHRHFTEEQPESLIKYKDCDICGKTVTNAWQLNRHKKYSHGKPKACKYCGKEFSDNSNLRVHMWGHTNTQPRCPICETTFRSTLKLNEHLDEEHPGMRKLVESGFYDQDGPSKPQYTTTHASSSKPATSARETATRQEPARSSLVPRHRDGDMVISKAETSTGEHMEETLALHETLALQDQAMVFHM